MSTFNLNLAEIQSATKEKYTGVIGDVIQKFDDKIMEAIAEIISSFENKLKIGYNNQKYHSVIDSITEDIETLNSMANAYCSLLNIKQPSLSTYEHIINLIKVGPNEVANALKKEYLTQYKISIEKFPFKMDKLIEVYEFSADELAIIDTIVSLVAPLKLLNGSAVKTYYDDESHLLVFTDNIKQTILEECALLISKEELLHILVVEMLCASLRSLKQEPYSFRQNLPEIDYRLMKYIKITKEDDLMVDLESMYEPMFRPIIRFLRN